MGGKHFGAVRRAAPDARPGVFVEHPGADLGIPEDLDLLALGVIGNAGEPQRGEIGLRVVERLDQPRPPAHLDEFSRLDGHAPANLS